MHITFIMFSVVVPPKQAPNARAQTSGCNGKLSALFWAKDIVILTIIVVNGMLSTKADAIAETLSKQMK